MAATKSETLLANAKNALDAIANDTTVDDDTKDEMFDELRGILDDHQSVINGEDDDEEDEEEDDPEEFDDEEEDE